MLTRESKCYKAKKLLSWTERLSQFVKLRKNVSSTVSTEKYAQKKLRTQQCYT